MHRFPLHGALNDPEPDAPAPVALPTTGAVSVFPIVVGKKHEWVGRSIRERFDDRRDSLVGTAP